MFRAFIAALAFALFTMSPVLAHGRQLQALVYGDAKNGITCDCADSLGKLIVNTPGYKINYVIVGPDGMPFTDSLLQKADIFAYPGGPDVKKAWKALKPHAPALRRWLRGGGRYVGSCLGAYLASSATEDLLRDGFNILPFNATAGQETSQPRAQVTDGRDTYIDVDWTWGSGALKGRTAVNRTLYFQDGVVIHMRPEQIKKSNSTILGRYHSNGDIAALVSPYGKGFVGVTGVHVEADQSWYDDAKFSNPQGVRPEYGYDLVATTLGSLGRQE